ncbi:hypothetical protein BH10BAC4_BH10BAC4_02360 [soil metagenome]
MSARLRNPFLVRSSEKVDPDNNFLRLFSHLALEVLIKKQAKDELWNNLLFLRSSPGGGKTSLLKIFEPSHLLSICTSNDYQDLFRSMQKLGAVKDDSPNLLGVFKQCTRNYGVLEDLSLMEGNKTRIFFALINARVTVATLRSICALKRLRFPEDLDKVIFTYNNAEQYFSSQSSIPKNGQQLLQWAAEIESSVFVMIDSLLPKKNNQIIGHNEPFSLEIMSPANFQIDGKAICEKFLIMLDDAHKLSRKQRDSLIKYTIEKRKYLNVWISERLEALDEDENLSSFINRDYQELNLEQEWSETSLFEKTLSNIASKRALISTEPINTFQDNLDNSIAEETFEEKIRQAIITLKQKIKTLHSYSPNKFQNWIGRLEEPSGNLWEQVLYLKKMEILMNRNLQKRAQMAFDFPLTMKELDEKMESKLNNVAALFLNDEFKIPFYFDFNNLVRISSSNIDQFLTFSSKLFEGMISNHLVNGYAALSAEAQEKIIKRTAEEKWKELNRLIPESKTVMRFLSEFAKFAYKETFRPSAPYAPGVTGFAIDQGSNYSLISKESWMTDPVFKNLKSILSTCLVYNLLYFKDTLQGAKGQSARVFYLNRWLCVKFNLALGSGGFRHKSPNELVKWM